LSLACELTCDFAAKPVLVILSEFRDVLKVLRGLRDEGTLLEIFLLVGQVVLAAELRDLLSELRSGEMTERVDNPMESMSASVFHERDGG
jgi:hypothetical protein